MVPEPTVVSRRNMMSFPFKEVWRIYLLAVYISFIDCDSPQLFLCDYPVENTECELRCSTKDFSEVIEYFVNGTSRGTCTIFGCGAGITKNATTMLVTLTISALSYSNDVGKWKCSYGGNASSEMDLIVYGNPSKVNITMTNPNAGTSDIEKVDLTAEMECAYPSTPSITLEFREEKSSAHLSIHTAEKNVVSNAAPSGQCSFALETFITAEIQASHSDSNLAGKKGFLRVKFFYTEDVEFFTDEVGPFTFKEPTTAPSTATPTNITTTTGPQKSWQIPVIAAGGSLLVLVIFVCIIVFVVKKTRNKKEIEIEKTAQAGVSESNDNIEMENDDTKSENMHNKPA